MVHQGFLEAYTVKGLNVRLLRLVKAIMAGISLKDEGKLEAFSFSRQTGGGGEGDSGGDGCSGSGSDREGSGSSGGSNESSGGATAPCRQWRVLCVGHSLGGWVGAHGSPPLLPQRSCMQILVKCSSCMSAPAV